MLCGTSDRGRRITLTWFFGSWVVRKGSRRNWVRLMLNDGLYHQCTHASTRYCWTFRFYCKRITVNTELDASVVPWKCSFKNWKCWKYTPEIYIYTHTHTHIYIYIYIYVHIWYCNDNICKCHSSPEHRSWCYAMYRQGSILDSCTEQSCFLIVATGHDQSVWFVLGSEL